LKRTLAIDYGSKRIGLAVSDGLGITAQGLDTLERTSVEEDIAFLLKLIEERDVGEVVVGYPLRLDGSKGQAAEETSEFAELVRARCGVPVQLWDERLSTAQAEKVMLGADVSRKVRKKSRDRMAAQFILQSFMDARKRSENA
jgi:putative Holliday junction resolvase